MNSTIRTMFVAGTLSVGFAMGIGAFSARGQSPTVAGPIARPSGGYYFGAPYPYSGANRGYSASLGGGNPSRINPGPIGPGPDRDWSTGRDVRLAKPWLRPLPR